MRTTIYHVCRGEWDGSDLLALARRMPQWGDEVCALIEASWPDCDAWTYYNTEAMFVHCHETIEQARDFAEEFGGQVLAIDAADLTVGVGDEYPHPVVRDMVPAALVARI